ncbi:MAG: NAD(P)/FAD-dependent oxidoreductase [Elusimicrobia bacterium]|nr:NAD(P)/FAD-dependent oxidoreductase [Elusimicrobiota bacterium]
MAPRVAVVGAGASGLAAAVAAARRGAQVVVIERFHAPGRKILASGGGRCNLTNSRIRPENYHGGSPGFVREALRNFSAADFFSRLGLLTREEPDGRIFPRCGKAQAVLDVLKNELERLGVELRLGVEAGAARRSERGFSLRVASEELHCDRLILACGGRAAPQLGAGENAYALAEALGHGVTPLFPALVPLCVKESGIKRLHGLRVEAGLRLLDGAREVCRSQGEVLFTDYGLSGPAALDVSREASRGEARGGTLDLFPEFTPQGLRAMLLRRWHASPARPLKDFFAGMLARQLSGAVMDALGWDARRPLESLGGKAVERLAGLLSQWPFELAGTRPWSDAMVTAGGIRLDEIDPRTMASRKVPGLFIAGELLDVDGDSGGYNLHFAWASGLAAGLGATLSETSETPERTA